MRQRKFPNFAGIAMVAALWLSLSPIVFTSVFRVDAAEVKLLSGRGFRSVLDALVGEFKRATGPGHPCALLSQGELIGNFI